MSKTNQTDASRDEAALRRAFKDAAMGAPETGLLEREDPARVAMSRNRSLAMSAIAPRLRLLLAPHRRPAEPPCPHRIQVRINPGLTLLDDRWGFVVRQGPRIVLSGRLHPEEFRGGCDYPEVKADIATWVRGDWQMQIFA